MRLITVAVGLVILAGCGRAPTLEEEREFRPYLNSFKQAAAYYAPSLARQVDDIPVYFGQLNGKTEAGECEQGFLRGNRITVDQRVWQRLNSTEREILMFHELGHCILGREHRDEPLPSRQGRGRVGEVPSSVMNSRLISAGLYSNYRNYYLDELFRGKKPSQFSTASPRKSF